MSSAQRIKDRLFPGEKLFNPKKGGYSALPFILRKVQFLFDPRAWQVYTYILMRTGPEGLAWFDLKEMAFDLQFKSTPKLKPYADKLVEGGWIRHAQTSGKNYYIIRDPFVVINEMFEDVIKRSSIAQERWDDINDLLEKLDKPSLGSSDAFGDSPKDDSISQDTQSPVESEQEKDPEITPKSLINSLLRKRRKTP